MNMGIFLRGPRAGRMSIVVGGGGNVESGANKKITKKRPRRRITNTSGHQDDAKLEPL